MAKLEDTYSSTPPPGVSRQIQDLVTQWVKDNPRNADPEKAYGRCSHATGSFVRYAYANGVTLGAIKLTILDDELAGGISRALFSHHIVVNLGNGNVFDPTARQYHPETPIPAYSTYHKLQEQWELASAKVIRGVPKIFEFEGWAEDRKRRTMGRAEFTNMFSIP